jgi:large subunit ribosomal protein L16
MQDSTKYKKLYKKKSKNYKFNSLIQGIMGIRVLESCRLTIKQLESIRRVFVRVTKREGRFNIRVNINQSVTKKSKGSRMGKGVGAIDKWVIDVKPGQFIFEFSQLNEKAYIKFLLGIKGKIPAKVEIVLKEIGINEL